MTEPTRIFHNPRCSKSRQTLALLQNRGIEPEIIHYLETPPDEAMIRDILGLLNTGARSLIRTGEAEYKELGLDDSALSEDELIHALTTHPKLIERPIVLHQGRAALGRPPEKVLEIL
jgi:arsenate reductase